MKVPLDEHWEVETNHEKHPNQPCDCFVDHRPQGIKYSFGPLRSMSGYTHGTTKPVQHDHLRQFWLAQEEVSQLADLNPQIRQG